MKTSLTKIAQLVALMYAATSGEATANVNFTQNFDYDEYGAVKYLKFDGKNIKFGYDLTGNHSRVRYNGHALFEVSDYDGTTGSVLSYKLGAVAHSSTVGQSVSYDDAQFQVDLGFDQLGSMQVQSLSDSFSADLPVMMQYGYKTNARGLVTKANKDVASNNALAKRQQFEYDYTTQGQLANYQWQGTDQYSAVGEIPAYNQSQSLNYNYDDRGNVNSKTGGGIIGSAQDAQSYNSKNQPEVEGFVYDSRGRLKEDADYIYRYNQLDRLALVIDKSTGLYSAHYLYDANGYRVRKVSQTTSIYYDRDGSGNLLHEKHFDVKTKALLKTVDYVNANGMNVAAVHYIAKDGDAAQLQQEKIVYQYSGGLQGTGQVNWTSIPLDSELASAGVEQNEYSPFGQPLADTDSDAYGYTGHEFDKETDAHYMKARYYDHDYGRFKSPDPARDTDLFNPKSFNLYSYVGNDPVNKTDPTGMFAKYHSGTGAGTRSQRGTGGVTNVYDKAYVSMAAYPDELKKRPIIVDVTVDTVVTFRYDDEPSEYLGDGLTDKQIDDLLNLEKTMARHHYIVRQWQGKFTVNSRYNKPEVKKRKYAPLDDQHSRDAAAYEKFHWYAKFFFDPFAVAAHSFIGGVSSVTGIDPVRPEDAALIKQVRESRKEYEYAAFGGWLLGSTIGNIGKIRYIREILSKRAIKKASTIADKTIK